MLFDANLVLREGIVQELLQSLKANSISLFVGPIVAAKLLQTVIRQMNSIVAIGKYIAIRGGS